MSLRSSALLVHLLVALASVAAGCSGSPATPDAGTEPPDAGSMGQDAQVDATLPPMDGGSVDASTPMLDADVPERERLVGLTMEVATAICDTLYRCCDSTEDRAQYFAAMEANERLADLRDRIPEDGVLAAADCPDLVHDIYEIIPLGGWVREALLGRVTFHPSEVDACLGTLRTASCGEDIRAALRDGTCFGFGPPGGGEEQRRAFSREQTEGAPCRAITDGVGSTLFGSCDPTRAFCCIERDGRCSPALDGDGTCHAASDVGEMCGFVPRLAICRTGLDCNDESRCEEAMTAQLALGATCAEGFSLLGDCVDSYCDLGGTNVCVALRADGAACTAGYECAGGLCDAMVCGQDAWCSEP